MTEPVSHHTRNVAYGIDGGSTAALYRVSWGAILAGVAVGLVVQFLLNLLGVGIGAAVIDPAQYDNPNAGTFSIAGGIWFMVAGLIASFVGGYIASRLSGRPSNSTGGYQGLTTWAVTTLVILYLLTTSVGALIGGAFNGLTSIVNGVSSTAATAVTAAAPAAANADNPMASIEQQIRSASGGNDPEALRDAAVSAVQAAATGDQAKAGEARTRAADALARAQNIPIEQARTQVDEYVTTYNENVEAAKANALEAAQTATKAVSTGSIAAFIALLIGAVAAWFGGIFGTKHNLRATETTVRHVR
jgi:hypothetical protein